MGFTEVSSLDADTTVALGKVDKKTGKAYPKQAEGYYLGKRSVEGKKGPSRLHFLQTAKGNLGVWGTTDLDRKLSQVTPGAMIRVTSTGTKETPKGDMYTYKVEIDKGNTIEVSSATEDFSDLNEDGNVDDSVGSGDNQESDEAYDSQAVAMAQAARRAEVEAVLKSRNSKKN